MKRNLNLALLFLFFSAFFHSICQGAVEDFYVRDKEAVYEELGKGKDTLSNLVIAIPGYKLDPENALKLPKVFGESTFARIIDPQILDMVRKYREYLGNGRSLPEYKLYMVKKLGNYMLLYFEEPQVKDGGFEIVYSRKLKKIIGSFCAGYRG